MMLQEIKIIGERAKQVRHSQVCSIENRDVYTRKSSAKIEDVGLNELKSTETRNTH